MYSKRQQAGAVLPLVAIAMVSLFGFLALSLDVGLMMWRKSQMHTAIDAAALSAAQCRFVAVQSESDAEACGTETFTFNLAESDLTQVSPSFTWYENQYYVDASVTSSEMKTLFAGAFARTLGQGGLDLFSVHVKARAGLTGAPKADILPMVVDRRSMCAKNSVDPDCTREGYKSFPVRAWALLNRKGEKSPKPKKLFHWLAGGKGDGVSFNVPYRLCLEDSCEEPWDYEDVIEYGLNTRFECEVDDDDTPEGQCGEEDDDEEFVYDPAVYPPDTYVRQLGTGNDYSQYFVKTRECDEKLNGNAVARDDDDGDRHGCWKPDDDDPNQQREIAKPYRRVVMAGIGTIDRDGKGTRDDDDDDKYFARVAEAACFVLFNEVDDPEEEWEHPDDDDDYEGIWLKYVPPTSSYAKKYCHYGEDAGLPRLVLLGEML